MNRSIGKSPSKIIYGFHPRRVFQLSELKDGAQSTGYAKEFSQFMRKVHEM